MLEQVSHLDLTGDINWLTCFVTDDYLMAGAMVLTVIYFNMNEKLTFYRLHPSVSASSFSFVCTYPS